MDFGLEFFIWSRPVDGYVWESGTATPFFGHEVDRDDAKETRFLRWRTTEPRVYRNNLLQTEPALYRIFASIEPTETAFLKFANDYGALGTDVLLEDAYIKKTENGKPVRQLLLANPRNHGEPLWRWQRSHADIRTITDLLMVIENDDIDALRSWFKISDGVIAFESANHWELLSHVEHQQRVWLWDWVMRGRDEADQLRRAARGFAQHHVNQAMSGAGGRHQSLTSARILLNTDRDALRLHLVPDTLLAAMWLQCARVLTENASFRTCESCGKWFELSPTSRRRHSKYCSDRCKVRAYRARKNEATGNRHGEA